MAEAFRISIDQLDREPYMSIICYPRPSEQEFRTRLEELRKLDITELQFKGEKEVFNTPVLGKGYVGVVVIAVRDDRKEALKIRRVDADRVQMQHEGEMLKRANSLYVGPKLLKVGENFLLMQFIDGLLLPAWLEINRERKQAANLLRDVLEQCWRLDRVGLDHGELSHAPKHIIINRNGKPFIVDFESASEDRRPSNVTSICQFLFIGGAVAEEVAEILGRVDKETLIDALRDYKKYGTREGFKRVLEVCNISDNVS